MPTAIISGDTSATTDETVTLTATASGILPSLNLTGGGTFTFNENIPAYNEFEFVDDTIKKITKSLDVNDNVVVADFDTTTAIMINDKPIFSNDSRLLEITNA